MSSPKVPPLRDVLIVRLFEICEEAFFMGGNANYEQVREAVHEEVLKIRAERQEAPG